MPWPRSNLWVITADGWAFIIDGALAGLKIEINTVAIGSAGERVNFAFKVEMVDEAFFFEPFGYLSRGFLCFKVVDDAHPDEVFERHFNRHSAAKCLTIMAEPFAVFDPSGWVVDIDRDDFSLSHR